MPCKFLNTTALQPSFSNVLALQYLSVGHPPYFKGLDYIYEDRGEVCKAATPCLVIRIMDVCLCIYYIPRVQGGCFQAYIGKPNKLRQIRKLI